MGANKNYIMSRKWLDIGFIGHKWKEKEYEKALKSDAINANMDLIYCVGELNMHVKRIAMDGRLFVGFDQMRVDVFLAIAQKLPPDVYNSLFNFFYKPPYNTNTLNPNYKNYHLCPIQESEIRPIAAKWLEKPLPFIYVWDI